MEDTAKHSKTGSKNGKFNVLDIVIIIFVVFVVAIIIMATISGSRSIITTGEKANITYKITFYGLNKEYIDIVKEDQKAIDAANGCGLGIVSEVIYEDAYEFVMVTDEEGNKFAEKRVDPDILGYNVTVTITADAIFNDGTGYTVDGYRIAVGKEINVRFPDFVGTGKCVSLDVAN